MKLISLNVWHGRLERVLLKHLKNQTFDLACMQEGVDYKGQSLGMVSSYQTIGKSLGMENQFFSKLLSTKLGGKDIAFGNVTYSRIPFLRTSTIFTRGEHNEDYDFDTDDYNIHAFQHVLIEVGGKTLNVLNHHGHHIDSHKLGDEETFRQVKQIVDYISKLDGAVILCGDFNLAPESESIGLLDKSLRNLAVENSLKTTRSKLTYKNEVCDYVFVNGGIVVNNFKMDETIISDHNALILDFDLK